VLGTLSLLLLTLGVAVWVGSRREQDVERIIQRWSAAHRVDPLLVRAMIRAESGFRPAVVSRKGAVGLMQLRPDTAQEIAGKIGLRGFQAERLTEPETNIRLGTFYLAELLRRFPDRRLALAAYNAGPTRVSGWMRQHPKADAATVLRRAGFRETRDYVAQVLRYLERG
jgi:soluble lytic murein transglycosylase